MFETFPEELNGEVLTLVANDLSVAGGGGLLGETKKETFLSVVE